MKIVVVGLGTIGLPVAAAFASVGCEVVGVEESKSVRASITLKRLEKFKLLTPIKMFDVTSNIDVVKDADAIVVCVGLDWNGKEPVFDPFVDLLRVLGRRIKKGVLICVETTIPPGTMVGVVKTQLEMSGGLIAGKDFYLVHAPERIAAGREMYNLLFLPRVIGGYSEKCRQKGLELYSKINKNVTLMSLETAEITKLVENAYRDVNIAFANEVSLICDAFGVDVGDVRVRVNELPDIIGAMNNPVRNMHVPGIGVGGYCLPKDSHLLLWGWKTLLFPNCEYRPPVPSVIENARWLNDMMPERVAGKINRLVENRCLKDPRILILGVGFAPGITDNRNSPAIELFKLLHYRTYLHDPYQKRYRNEIDADITVLATAHDWYRLHLEPLILEALLRDRVVCTKGERIWK